MRLIEALRSRLRGEDGFTIVAVIGFMMVGTLFALSALAAATGDLPAGRDDQDRKRAYAAAEAGINDYVFQLSQDGDYWASCDDVSNPDPDAVNQPLPADTAASPATLDTRLVPGTTDARYGIELLPKDGASTCTPGLAAQNSMIESNGTFRIRSTGMVRGQKRSIVATFRKRSFLDFIYFTDFEMTDPTLIASEYESYINDSRDPLWGDWYAQFCATNYWWSDAERQGREPQRYPGRRRNGDSWGSRERECPGPIQFANDDRVLGQFHSNDTILVNGAPRFGRETLPAGTYDEVETAGPAPGWRGSAGSAPVFNTESRLLTTDARELVLPPSNLGVRTNAQNGGLLLTGRSTIQLGTTQMTVNGVPTPFPANGVIFVQDAEGVSCAYQRRQRYDGNPGCGDVYVRGTYSRDLTIAAENDIVVYDNLSRDATAPDALLGLIADKFVRVYHPVTSSNNNCGSNSSTSAWGGFRQNITIDAAILALTHSFLVDNWGCGSKLGTLTVNGAIAQSYRGPVGTGGSSGTGYTKSYVYNDRLRFRSPPRFLDPVQSAWRVLRSTEQVPAK